LVFVPTSFAFKTEHHKTGDPFNTAGVKKTTNATNTAGQQLATPLPVNQPCCPPRNQSFREPFSDGLTPFAPRGSTSKRNQNCSRSGWGSNGSELLIIRAKPRDKKMATKLVRAILVAAIFSGLFWGLWRLADDCDGYQISQTREDAAEMR
jgi:hypothetical protein